MRSLKINQELLDLAGVMPEEAAAIREAAIEGGAGVGRVLVQQKKLREADLLDFYARRFQLDVVETVPRDQLEFGLVEQFSIGYLKKSLAVPFRGTDGFVYVAVSDPLKGELLDDFRSVLGFRDIRLVLSGSQNILSTINQLFGEADSKADELISDLGENTDELFSELEEHASEDLLDETSDAPIIKLVNHILAQSVRSGASDIHIEPYNNDLKVRFRLDGVLHNILSLPRRLHPAVASRLKIMAKLNIAEKRLPQDGRIEIKIGNREVDLRVSSLPTAFGERVVMRLLEKNARLLTLEELGFTHTLLTDMERLLSLSNGIILVTGPTGSGKTTTLYAGLSRINSPDKNILTIEDPIEYQLDGIGQMQVNSKIDLSFARGLRAMVRQDPDVILIGEIRDLETAEIAIQASLTGHLVFSTLHTNDAASAITRLIDMGIEPFLASSAVRAILAQRLLRVLCPHCKQPHDPTPMDLAELGLTAEQMAGRQIYSPVGCRECLDTGYKGRTAIYEMMQIDENIQELMLKTSDSNQLRNLAVSHGMKTLRDDGVRLVLEGKTTVDEVMRVTLL